VFFPGTSLKGVVRSHLEKVSRTLNEPVICNPFDKTFCGEKLQDRKRREFKNASLPNDLAYRESCPICRLFGSTFFTGRISISDAYLVDSKRPMPTELRDGVGIDRLSGGAAHGAKFDLEAVSPGVVFETRVYLRNFETWQLGMLLLAVKDMEDELIRLGSGTSRGFGNIAGQVSEVEVNHVGRQDNRPATEVWGLGQYLTSTDGNYGLVRDDRLILTDAPAVERHGIRQVQKFTGAQLTALQEQAMGVFVDRLEQWGR
jgi:CRISPR-associated RAMP protein (TIGR02581 family)